MKPAKRQVFFVPLKEISRPKKSEEISFFALNIYDVISSFF